MPMIPLSLLRVVAVAAIGLCLAGCGRTETYRYKLTLAVDTPEGVKRASSVVEVLFYSVSFPERGIMHKLRGEALYGGSHGWLRDRHPLRLCVLRSVKVA